MMFKVGQKVRFTKTERCGYPPTGCVGAIESIDEIDASAMVKWCGAYGKCSPLCLLEWLEAVEDE